MKTTMRLALRLALLALLLLSLCGGLAACSDDDGPAPDKVVTPHDAGPEAGDDAGDKCKSFATEHERLLNAPTSATVIRKTPTHPPVGDGGLP